MSAHEDRDYYAIAYDMVLAHFKDDEKVDLWLEARNPLLGEQTPLEMIRDGRGEKLLTFILQAREAGRAP